ncbi:hypothetical protein [Paraburkholderia sediminicola]|uniref:hypothetical protein n=1 Tax=Paraburkholderia sediminicola TaxID=458836 RepID=UPI001581F721|nr:hypothetical protein [Paraburkholderia sediminicola]
MNPSHTTAFFNALDNWTYDGYHVDQRLIARRKPGENQIFEIWGASIVFHPVPAQNNYSGVVRTETVFAEQLQKRVDSKDEIVEIVNRAMRGEIQTNDGISVCLRGVLGPTTEINREGWFFDSNICVVGDANGDVARDLQSVDNELRLAEIPFDGISDLAGWFGITLPIEYGTPSITVRIAAPADLRIAETILEQDKLSLVIHTHPAFDTSQLRLALRAVPGDGLSARMQVAQRIEWASLEGRLEGTAVIPIKDADQVLTMLMVGKNPVRRQWFADKTKARNQRLMAYRLYDKDLSQLRKAVLKEDDSSRFEKAVAGMLFLRGFTPVELLETDGPDLIVATPLGRLAIIECTLRSADIAKKIGKLVDRRAKLEKALEESKHLPTVIAVLVCRQDANELAAEAKSAEENRVLLVTGENLRHQLDVEPRAPVDPDSLYEQALQMLATKRL